VAVENMAVLRTKKMFPYSEGPARVRALLRRDGRDGGGATGKGKKKKRAAGL
jgi:hypothetical protein